MGRWPRRSAARRRHALGCRQGGRPRETVYLLCRRECAGFAPVPAMSVSTRSDLGPLAAERHQPMHTHPRHCLCAHKQPHCRALRRSFFLPVARTHSSRPRGALGAPASSTPAPARDACAVSWPAESPPKHISPSACGSARNGPMRRIEPLGGRAAVISCCAGRYAPEAVLRPAWAPCRGVHGLCALACERGRSCSHRRAPRRRCTPPRRARQLSHSDSERSREAMKDGR